MFKEVESLVEQAQPAAKPEGLTLLDRFDVDLFFSRGTALSLSLPLSFACFECNMKGYDDGFGG